MELLEEGACAECGAQRVVLLAFMVVDAVGDCVDFEGSHNPSLPVEPDII